MSIYHDTARLRNTIAAGHHRSFMGGFWDELGTLQLEMLKARGLRPGHRLLDLGCGSLRLGVKAVPYLDPGDYWGLDQSQDLLDAGYEQEIVPLGLQDRLPRDNLIASPRFRLVHVPRRVDFAIAHSLFTHLPLNQMRLALANLAAHAEAPCRFYFTVFLPVPGKAPGKGSPQKAGLLSFSYKEPFHYDWDDILHAGRGLGWALRLIGDWGHPRNQKLVEAILA